MAQQSVTGPEEPVISTVLTSTHRVWWFKSANSHTGQQLSAASQAGQMAASDYPPTPQLPLAPLGASTDGKRTSEIPPHRPRRLPRDDTSVSLPRDLGARRMRV